MIPNSCLKSGTRSLDRNLKIHARQVKLHSTTSTSGCVAATEATSVTEDAKCFSNRTPRSRANCASKLKSGSMECSSLFSMNSTSKPIIFSSWYRIWARLSERETLSAWCNPSHMEKFCASLLRPGLPEQRKGSSSKLG